MCHRYLVHRFTNPLSFRVKHKPTKPTPAAEPWVLHQTLITGLGMAQSMNQSMAEGIAKSMAESMAQSMAESIARSMAQSMAE